MILIKYKLWNAIRIFFFNSCSKWITVNLFNITDVTNNGKFSVLRLGIIRTSRGQDILQVCSSGRTQLFHDRDIETTRLREKNYGYNASYLSF